MATITGTVSNDTLYGTANADVLFGRGGSDFLYGNGGNDILRGGGGADTLFGGVGNDRLIGEGGRDTLTGGAGSDVFVFNRTSGDTIADFETGIDKIDIGAFMSAAQFHFIGSSAFTGVAGQGRFSNGQFQIDLDGDRDVDFWINVSGQLTVSDLFFGSGSGGGDPCLGCWDY